MSDQPDVVLRLQARVLEKIAVGAELKEVLDELCGLVESMVPGAICSTMLLEASGEMKVAAAPSASPALIAALNGLVPSDMAGSCGTAVFQKRPVYVRDTSCDPRWVELQDAAREFGIAACWSVPIFAPREVVLGSFAISHQRKCEPTEQHKQILRTASQLAGLALEREAVQHAQRLESLGVLAGGVAHDFNNLLVGIMGNAHLALTEVAAGSPAFSFIRDIEKASKRAAELIKQLLAYAGKAKLRVETLDLSAAVQDMAELLRSSVSRKIEIKCELAQAPPWIEADATQVRQMVMNLVTNAGDAIGENTGNIHVRTGVTTVSEDCSSRCFRGDELPAGDYAYLEVQDSGCGMDENVSERIFDPFFTTKATGRGLGLASTLGAVKGHGGAIELDSKPRVGTRLRVLFPLSQAAEPPGDHSPPVAEKSPANATVLVVDDEELVVAVVEQMLSREGYRVMTAPGGREAVKIARASAVELDAVVLDATMPGMDGEATFAALRRIRSDLPVVFCSGYGSADGASLVAGRPATAFLSKPFSPSMLSDAVSDLLENGARSDR